MKKGLDAFTPSQVASLRIFIGSIVFIPVAIHSIRHLKIKNGFYILLIGFFGTGIPPFLFTQAQTVINSSTAGMLNSLTPLFALVIGFVFFKMKMEMYKITGVLLGLAGAAALFIFKSDGNLNVNAYGLLVVLAAVLYAVSSTLIKIRLQQMNPLHITSFIFLFVGPPAGVYLLFSDLPKSFEHPLAWQSFSYILILGLVNTALVTFLFNKLIRNSSAIFAQSVTYLMPVVAILWGILDGETLGFIDFAGIAFILSGIYLINKRG